MQLKTLVLAALPALALADSSAYYGSSVVSTASVASGYTTTTMTATNVVTQTVTLSHVHSNTTTTHHSTSTFYRTNTTMTRAAPTHPVVTLSTPMSVPTPPPPAVNPHNAAGALKAGNVAFAGLVGAAVMALL